MSGGSSELQKKQDNWLKNLIEKRATDIDFIYLLFQLICRFPEENRSQFIAVFIKHNPCFEDFKKLPLEPQTSSTVGSWISFLQKQINYFESLLPLFNTVDYLDHKEYLEKHIQSLQKEKEEEKNKEFMEYYS